MIAYLAFLAGHWEIIAIILVALLLFGHRIPGMARSLGSGIVEFRKGLKGEGVEDDGKQVTDSGESPQAKSDS